MLWQQTTPESQCLALGKADLSFSKEARHTIDMEGAQLTQLTPSWMPPVAKGEGKKWRGGFEQHS